MLGKLVQGLRHRANIAEYKPALASLVQSFEIFPKQLCASQGHWRPTSRNLSCQGHSVGTPHHYWIWERRVPGE